MGCTGHAKHDDDDGHDDNNGRPPRQQHARPSRRAARMPVVPSDKLVALQQAADGIRNICILAHVVRLPRAGACAAPPRCAC